MDNHLITSNTTLLQKNYGFQDYIYQSVQQTVQCIVQKNLVENIENYVNDNLEVHFVNDNPLELNEEIKEMLEDFRQTKLVPISFLTPSRFEQCFEWK